MLKNISDVGILLVVPLSTVLGGLAGAVYTFTVIFHLPGYSDPPLNEPLALILNVILKAIAGCIASSAATVAGFLVHQATSIVWLELVVVFWAALAAIFVACYVTFSVVSLPHFGFLAIVAGLIALTYFGASRGLVHIRRSPRPEVMDATAVTP